MRNSEEKQANIIANSKKTKVIKMESSSRLQLFLPLLLWEV